MIASILAILAKLLGYFLPDPPSPEATAEATGEAAGKAKSEDAAAQVTIQDVKTAQAVRQQVKATEPPAGVEAPDDGFELDR